MDHCIYTLVSLVQYVGLCQIRKCKNMLIWDEMEYHFCIPHEFCKCLFEHTVLGFAVVG